MNPALRFCNLSRTPPVIKDEKLIVCHVGCDLAQPGEVARAAAEVEAFLNRDVQAGRLLLINNSGFGSYGRFPEPNLTQQLQILDVNIRAMVELTGRLLPVFRVRGGVVLNLGSTAGCQPMPHMAVYGASKAFVLHWTLALAEEWRGTNLRAMAVCPGPTRTAFFRRAGLAPGNAGERTGMAAEDVVTAALRGIARGQTVVVPGWLNKLITLNGRLGVNRWTARVAGAVVAKHRLSKDSR